MKEGVKFYQCLDFIKLLQTRQLWVRPWVVDLCAASCPILRRSPWEYDCRREYLPSGGIICEGIPSYPLRLSSPCTRSCLVLGDILAYFEGMPSQPLRAWVHRACEWSINSGVWRKRNNHGVHRSWMAFSVRGWLCYMMPPTCFGPYRGGLLWAFRWPLSLYETEGVQPLGQVLEACQKSGTYSNVDEVYRSTCVPLWTEKRRSFRP